MNLTHEVTHQHDVVEHREITEADVRYLVQHMRSRDRQEIFAMRWTDSDDDLIRDVLAVAGPLWRVWTYQGVPAAIIGAVPMRPGVASAASWGTDQWRHVIRPMSTWAMEWLIPALSLAGYHRGEAYVAAANAQSRRWLPSLGAEIEAYLQRYGRDREDFVLYTWRLDDVSQIRRRRWRGQWTANGLSHRP